MVSDVPFTYFPCVCNPTTHPRGGEAKRLGPPCAQHDLVTSVMKRWGKAPLKNPDRLRSPPLHELQNTETMTNDLGHSS